ncbi:uncharacterized protein LOC126973619 [Leptidea sinapis]|uniref:uncharacterized protein LOC126973619 n=1 Tax=Leptidea sinapis TaxID=189913 RepID=UPI0021C46E84|nr:uncharacterized protein LOC126973619 [Leptidea sinapis]
MSDWSATTILTFLEAYQNEPCLWNPKDADHKHRQKVNDAWTRLSIIMNKRVKELKTKKEILMATFRRHLKKTKDSIRSGAGSDDVYTPVWFAYDLMESFLGPVYTCSNNVNSEERALPEENETAAIEDVEFVENRDLEQPLPTPKPVRRRPATETAERQMSSAFGQLTNILSKRQREYPPPPPKEDDDCELYGKLLAKKLRELSPDERKLFMYNIDTLFINRIKDRLFKRQTPSPQSAPYQAYSVPLPKTSLIPIRPSTSQTSYSEPLPNNSPSAPYRPSSSETSYSEPLPNTLVLGSNQLSTAQTSQYLSLVINSPQPFTSQNHVYFNQSGSSNSTPTIQIISNELISQRTETNRVNEALIKAYEDFDREN